MIYKGVILATLLCLVSISFGRRLTAQPTDVRFACGGPVSEVCLGLDGASVSIGNKGRVAGLRSNRGLIAAYGPVAEDARWRGVLYSERSDAFLLHASSGELRLVQAEDGVEAGRYIPRKGLAHSVGVFASSDLLTVVVQFGSGAVVFRLEGEKYIPVGEPINLSEAKSQGHRQGIALQESGDVIAYSVNGGVQVLRISGSSLTSAGVIDMEFTPSSLAFLPGEGGRLLCLGAGRAVIRSSGGDRGVSIELDTEKRSVIGVDMERGIVLVACAYRFIEAYDLQELQLQWRKSAHGAVLLERLGLVAARQRSWGEVEFLSTATGDAEWALDSSLLSPTGWPMEWPGEEVLYALDRSRTQLMPVSQQLGGASSLRASSRPVSRDVVACGVSPGNEVWAVYSDGQVVVFGASGGEEIARSTLTHTAVAAELLGDFIAVDFGAGALELIPIDDLEVARTIPCSRALLVPSGDIIAWGQGVKGWVSYSVSGEFEILGSGMETIGTLTELGVSADGGLIVAIGISGEVAVSASGVESVLRMDFDPRAVLVSPGGEWFLVCGDGGQVVRYPRDLQGGGLELSVQGWFPFGVEIRDIVHSPGGRVVLASTGDFATIQAWDAESWEHKWFFDYGSGNPGCLYLHVSASSGRIWAGGMGESKAGVFELTTGRKILDLSGQGYGGRFSSSSPKYVASARDGGVSVFLASGELLYDRVDSSGGGVVKSPDGALEGERSTLERIFLRADGRVQSSYEYSVR